MLDAQPDRGLDRQQSRIGPIPVRCGSRHGPRWFVATTHDPAVADTNLANQHFEAWFPTIAVRRRDPRGRWDVVPRPLFGPSYIFVRFNPAADPWGVILSTYGVRSIIMFELGIPAPCQEGAVEALQAGEEARRLLTHQPDETLRALSSCQVVAGPFRGHRGQVVAVNGGRVVVTLMIFGRLQDVHVAASCLEAA
jgi:transcriptional antiterminator RfaH